MECKLEASDQFMGRAGCWWQSWCNIPTRLFPEPSESSPMRNDRGRKALGIDWRTLYSCALSLIHTLFAHTRTYSHSLLGTPTLLHKLLLSHTLWKSVTKAHCFDSRHMRSRRRVCRLINHLAADDLWREYHDKVCEPCTFNYRSEGRAYISMQHPSPRLLIALRYVCMLCVCVYEGKYVCKYVCDGVCLLLEAVRGCAA